MCGIYKIQNKRNGKIYIGQSIHIEQRFDEHLDSLRKNKHHNRHLQFAYNKYGEAAFAFTIIQICDECDLDFYENKYIIEFDSVSNGYNLTYGGDSSERSEETRKRLSLATSLLWKDNDYRQHMSDAHKGQPYHGGGIAKGTHKGFESSCGVPILVDGILFGSKALAGEYIGCSAAAINKAIQQGRKCKNHKVELYNV